MELLKKPKTKRGEETLRRICEAAEALFAENGYYDTQISDITRQAGIAAGTFYIYFPDKLSAFRYLLEELGHQLRREIRAATQGTRSIFDAEERSVRVFFDFVSRHFGLFKIVWQAQFVDMDAFKNYYERFSSGYVSQFERAQARGEIRAFDPECLSYYLMGMYNFVAMKYLLFDRREPDEEVIRQMVDFIRHGLMKP